MTTETKSLKLGPCDQYDFPESEHYINGGYGIKVGYLLVGWRNKKENKIGEIHSEKSLRTLAQNMFLFIQNIVCDINKKNIFTKIND